MVRTISYIVKRVRSMLKEISEFSLTALIFAPGHAGSAYWTAMLATCSMKFPRFIEKYGRNFRQTWPDGQLKSSSRYLPTCVVATISVGAE